VTPTYSLLSLQVASGQGPGLAWQGTIPSILVFLPEAELRDRQAASVPCMFWDQKMTSSSPWFLAGISSPWSSGLHSIPTHELFQFPPL
jgi:hypothetical protein